MNETVSDPVRVSCLRAIELRKTFKSRSVVDGISLDMAKGEIVGLLGPNGAGKTTCFYMLVGLVIPDSGQLYFNDRDITYLPVHQRARLGIGYLPQEASVFRKLSVADNIMAILELRKQLTAAQRADTLEHLLSEFHIHHIRDSKGYSLSGGERKRVEIARALANAPDIILLDEPFAGVDPISVIDIKNIIDQLRKKGVGILITDHNVRETLTICDRAYIVNEGKIIYHGNTPAIISNPQVRSVYLGNDFTI